MREEIELTKKEGRERRMGGVKRSNISYFITEELNN